MRERPSAMLRVANWSALLSAAIAAVGLVCFVLLYVGIFSGSRTLQAFGPWNDACIVVQCLLALPLVVVLDRVLRQHWPRASAIATLLGLAGIVGVVLFQSLLLTGRMSFAAQAPFAAVSLLTFGAWIWIATSAARRSGLPVPGAVTTAFAAIYLGYPLWAWQIGRRARRLVPSGATRGEDPA